MPSRLAISSRLIPCSTNSLMFSIACGVNLNRLPLAEGLAFGVVMAAPSSRPVVVWDRCPVHWAAALITPCFGHTVQNRDTAFDALEGNVAYQQRWQRRRAPGRRASRTSSVPVTTRIAGAGPGSPFGPPAIGTKQPPRAMMSVEPTFVASRDGLCGFVLVVEDGQV